MTRKHNDNLDLVGNQLIQVVLENLSSDPGSNLGDGRIWYDTVLDAVRVRANSATVSLATSAGAYTDENAQDAIATAFTNGTQTGVSVTYNDAGNSLSIAVVNDETTQDLIGAQVIADPSTPGGITVTYDDAGTGKVNIALANNEAFQDIVGAFLGVGTGNGGVTVTYDDANNRMNFVVTNDETFQDAVGAFLETDTGSTGITATYDDANGRMNLAVQYAAPNLTLSTTNSAGSANTAMRTDATILAFDATSPSTQAFSDTAVVGVATVAARRDHKHAMPAHTTALHQEMLATADLTDWPRVAALDMNSQKITGLLDGTAVTDAINLGQLQAAIEGRQWKDPVATATTGALPNSPTYSAGAGTLTAGSNTTLAAQASHTLTINERVLVKDQASTFQNGIYYLSATGSGAAPWVLTRVLDANTAAELSNATVMVEANDSSLRGKVYTQQNTLADLTAAAQSWTVTGDNNVYTVDGTTLTGTTQFSIANGGVGINQIATTIAGAGLVGGGGAALDVNTGTASASGLEINTDVVRIASAFISNGLQGGSGTALSVKLDSNPGLVTSGTGLKVDRSTNGQKVAWIYAVDLAGGSATETITHGFGSNDVVARVYNKSAGVFADEDFSIERPTTNTVLVRSSVTIPGATFRVVVFG